MYTDPTGQCPWCVGAATGAAIDIAIQLAFNGGRFECIKWEAVAVAAALGAVNPFSGAGAVNKALTAERQYARANNLRSGSSAARRTRQRGHKHNKNSFKEAASWAAIEGTAEGVGQLVPEDQHIRIGDDCGCK